MRKRENVKKGFEESEAWYQGTKIETAVKGKGKGKGKYVTCAPLGSLSDR